MPDRDAPAPAPTAGLRVTERIAITPRRRADERPAPLVVRFNPGRGAAGQGGPDQAGGAEPAREGGGS